MDAWLRAHATSIGQTVDADVGTVDLLAAPGQTVDPVAGQLVPLERLAVSHALSGARGTNRAPAFPYVRALHDLDALRAYRGELVRPLLWALVERSVPLSSLAVEDCDAYKAFLAMPSDVFCGPPASRASGRWRPFAPGGLSLESQRYAVRAIRAAYEWLVQVRYLAGNPWAAITAPKLAKRAQAANRPRAAVRSVDAHTGPPSPSGVTEAGPQRCC